MGRSLEAGRRPLTIEEHAELIDGEPPRWVERDSVVGPEAERRAA